MAGHQWITPPFPLLFLRDLTKALQSPGFFFEDDLKVFGSSGLTALSSDIGIVINWEKLGIYS